MGQKPFQILASFGLCLLLAACAGGPEVPEFPTEGKTLAPKKATSRPYQIKGVWYYPQPYYEYHEEGMASFYGGGDIFHGRPTATGERFDMNGVTAAHKTLPLPCIAKVTNLENGRELIVKVNDRGPFPPGRLLDLSRRGAQLLGFEHKGLAKVRVMALVPESLALNGIDVPTVMLAQAPPPPPPPPPSVASVPPAVPITITEVSAPSPLFEAIEETATVDEILPPEPMVMAEARPATPPLTAEASPSLVAEKKSSPVLSSKKPDAPVSTGIFVYVGAFETQVKAQSISRSLQGYSNSPIEIVKNKGPKPYAASLGPLSSMFHANQVLDQLVNAGHLISRIVIHR